MEGSERKNSFRVVLPIVVQAEQQLSSDNPSCTSRHSSSQVLLVQQQNHHLPLQWEHQHRWGTSYLLIANAKNPSWVHLKQF